MNGVSRISVGVILIAATLTYGAVRTVPTDYATIQAAVNSAQAGDTVLILPGRYAEAVSLTTEGLMLAGRYLLTEDLADIDSTSWQGVITNDDTLRSLTMSSAEGTGLLTRVVGLRFVMSNALSSADGGAVNTSRMIVSVEHCVFDSCAARDGGAIAVFESQISLGNCRFNHCAHYNAASVLSCDGSKVKLDSCLITSSRALGDEDEIPQLFLTIHSDLLLRNCGFMDNGYGHHWLGTRIVTGFEPDSIEIVGSSFTDNRITTLVSGEESPHFFRLDSNRFWDNELSLALYGQSAYDSLSTFLAFDNTFESFTPVAGAQMHGLFALDTSYHHVTRIEHNLIRDIHGGHTSFCNILDDNEFERTIKHNYVLSNSNFSITWPPSGQVLTFGTGDGELEENVLMGNQGYAIYQGPPMVPTTSYARRNFFGHFTGPYDSLNNPGGQGDTIEWRIIYQPWALDSSFMSAVPEPQEPVAIPESFIGNAYPNPFNSSVTIEFVLLKDQEIKLAIFDLTGRQVHELFSGRMNRGVHIREWRPNAQASGIYFARLSTAEGVYSTSKLMYLK